MDMPLFGGGRGNSGFDFCTHSMKVLNPVHCALFAPSTGMSSTGFEDTWRIISGIARAVSRGVTVSIMVSAPCAYAAGDPHGQSYNQMNCPTDGTQGPGYDYWNTLYEALSGWPSPRSQDQFYAHITEGMSPLGAGGSRRKLSYGYGWSLESIADWIFAYCYAINKNSRPKNSNGNFLNAEQTAALICEKFRLPTSVSIKTNPLTCEEIILMVRRFLAVR